MRAAVVSELGVPQAQDFAEPQAGEGQAVVPVLAAGVNPVDVSIAAGRFYAGAPPLPFVSGREGVALLDGRRVYFDGPIVPYGSMAELALIEPAMTHELPDAVPDGVAIALGIAGLAAWLPLSWRAQLQPGEHALVLGASGVLGQIAVQAARSLRAGRVVAAARSREQLERSLQLGADATVELDGKEDLAERLSDAAEGRIDVVLDPLFGEPFAAALQAASFRARLVQIGTSAGATATIDSAPIRGKMLDVLGHTNGAAPPEVKWEAYSRMLALAAGGELQVEVEAMPLERVQDAWQRMQEGSHRKLVLVPEGTGADGAGGSGSNGKR